MKVVHLRWPCLKLDPHEIWVGISWRKSYFKCGDDFLLEGSEIRIFVNVLPMITFSFAVLLYPREAL